MYTEELIPKITPCPGNGIAHILFDLDGTLADTLPGIMRSAREAIRTVLVGSAIPDLRPFIGPPVREVFRRAIPGIDERILDQLVHAFRDLYNGGGWRESTLFPGVQDTLCRLSDKGMTLFVVTNKPAEPSGHILRHTGVSALFTGVVARDSRMPSFGCKEEMMAYCLDTWRLDPMVTLSVGDTHEDARAASANGMRFAAAAYGYGNSSFTEGINPIITMQSFGDLWPYILTANTIHVKE